MAEISTNRRRSKQSGSEVGRAEALRYETESTLRLRCGREDITAHSFGREMNWSRPYGNPLRSRLSQWRASRHARSIGAACEASSQRLLIDGARPAMCRPCSTNTRRARTYASRTISAAVHPPSARASSKRACRGDRRRRGVSTREASRWNAPPILRVAGSVFQPLHAFALTASVSALSALRSFSDVDRQCRRLKTPGRLGGAGLGCRPVARGSASL